MQLGFVTAILQNHSFEEVIDFAAKHGFKCVEVVCWPKEKADRRYAGVSHIDCVNLDDKKAQYIKDYCIKKGVCISSLAYYPNMLDSNLQKREKAIAHLKQVIAAAMKLEINLVTSFIGRVESKTVIENLDIAEKVWNPLMRFAEDHNVRIAIENCPMLFGAEQWPGGQNIFTSPENWRQVFQRITSRNLGINYDPSHFVWQMMDYVLPIYEFKDKIFHAHAKDIKVYKEKLNNVGIMAFPLEFMAPKLPGLGDISWGKYISALTDVDYDGPLCLEIEDRSFESSDEAILGSLVLSKRYIDQFII